MQAQPLSSYQHRLLLESLNSLFGDFDATVLNHLESQLIWLELAGGEVLFREKEAADAVFFVISGRLQVYVTEADGIRKIGEVIRGETVGEMSVVTRQPHSATAAAVRDTVLVKMEKPVFEALIGSYPKAGIRMTQLIVFRLRRLQQQKAVYKKPINICLLPLHDSLPPEDFAAPLIEALRAKGTLFAAYAAVVDEALQQPGIAHSHVTETEHYRRVTHWLNDKEGHVEFMVYVAEQENSEWTKRCLRMADQVLLLADATRQPKLTAIEQHHNEKRPLTSAHQTLVLIHPADRQIPRHTEQWLHHRPWIHSHYHCRRGLEKDVKRMARILSGTAIGLVCAGGGAKGFAQVGVLKALQEYGIPVDYVGGTSVGGMMAASIAFDTTAGRVNEVIHEGALFNPTKDLSWMPVISLVAGRRIERMIHNTILAFSGRQDVDVADTWLTLYVVSSNFSRAREHVHLHGSLATALKASTAIPGVFPPVIIGHDLLVDGGSFNNFPVDVMRKLGVTKVIGIDRFPGSPLPLKLLRVPSGWELFKDRFRPKARKKYHLPSLMSVIINALSLSSDGKRQENVKLIDLYFNPPVHDFGIVQWKSYEKIMQAGYDHAKEVLGNMSEEALAYYRS